MCRFPSTRSCLPTSPRAQHQGKHLTLRKRWEDWQRIDSRVYAWVQIQNSNSRSDLGEWHNDVQQHLRVSNRVNRKRSWKKLRLWREVAWSFCYSMFVRDSFLRLACGFLSFSWTVCHCVCFFHVYQTLPNSTRPETLPLPSKVSTSSHLRKFRESLLLRTLVFFVTNFQLFPDFYDPLSSCFHTCTKQSTPICCEQIVKKTPEAFTIDIMTQHHFIHLWGRSCLGVSFEDATKWFGRNNEHQIKTILMRSNSVNDTQWYSSRHIDTQNSTHQPSRNFQELAGMCLRANRSPLSTPTLGGISQHGKHYGFIMICDLCNKLYGSMVIYSFE